MAEIGLDDFNQATAERHYGLGVRTFIAGVALSLSGGAVAAVSTEATMAQGAPLAATELPLGHDFNTTVNGTGPATGADTLPNQKGIAIVYENGAVQYKTTTPNEVPPICRPPTNLRFGEKIADISVTPGGYDEFSNFGAVFPCGDAPNYGGFNGALNKLMIGSALTVNGDGYTLLAGDGGIFNYGPGSVFFGALPGKIGAMSRLANITAFDTTKAGYMEADANGMVWSFGDAPELFVPGTNKHLNEFINRLNKPIIGILPIDSADGRTTGALLVASDGGVFALGEATFKGSLGNVKITDPIVAMTAKADGSGYWLVDAKGKVTPFNAEDVESAMNNPNSDPGNSGGNQAPPETAPEIEVGNIACGAPTISFDKLRGNFDHYDVKITDSRYPGASDGSTVQVRPNTTPEGVPDHKNLDLLFAYDNGNKGTGQFTVSIRTPDGYGEDLTLLNTDNVALDPAHCPNGADLGLTMGTYVLKKMN